MDRTQLGLQNGGQSPPDLHPPDDDQMGIDIDFGTITRYTGTLKQAMRQKEANRQTYMKAYANQQRQIAKTEAYIRKNKAGTRAWFPWCQGAPAYMAVRSLLDGNLPQAQQEVQRVAIVTASIALGVLLSTMF